MRLPPTIKAVPKSTGHVTGSAKNSQPKNAAQTKAVYSTGIKICASARAYAQLKSKSEIIANAAAPA